VWPRATHANGWVVQHDADFAVRDAHLAHANWLRTYECKRLALAQLRARRVVRVPPGCASKARN